MKNIIEIENITKIYRSSLKGIKSANLKIPVGAFHGIIGVNGAGKTTLINAIANLTKKYSGKIKVNSKIGYVPEANNFPMGINTEKYLRNISFLAKLSKVEFFNKITKLLKEFNLDVMILKSKINKLSSGQKKKILLIQALLLESDILILDEPTANLDPLARNELIATLKKLNKDGKTIIVVSHNLEEIDIYLKTITVINDSEIIYDGDIKKFKKNKSLLSAFTSFVKGNK